MKNAVFEMWNIRGIRLFGPKPGSSGAKYLPILLQLLDSFVFGNSETI